MSTVEDIQKNLIEKIAQMQFEFEEQKKLHKAEIDKLEKIIKSKNDQLETAQINSTWDMVEDRNSIMKDQLEATQQMNAAFQADIQSKTKRSTERKRK